MKGFRVRYKFKGEEPSSKYSYQRFFRALYGYTQVVKKSNGKTYVYYREGVLTRYPYIRESKNTVIVPINALEPLVSFFREGKNPAHVFSYLNDWDVSYYVEQIDVLAQPAIDALESAIDRIYARTENGYIQLRQLIESDDVSVHTLYLIKEYADKIVESNWFKELYDTSEVLKLLYTKFMLSEKMV